MLENFLQIRRLGDAFEMGSRRIVARLLGFCRGLPPTGVLLDPCGNEEHSSVVAIGGTGSRVPWGRTGCRE